jgi:outer membrane protein
MRKVIFGLLFIGAILSSSVEVYSQKSFYIGIVDVESIVKEIPEALQADKKIKEIGQKYQDSLMAMQSDFEAKLKQYDKQKSMMPSDQQQKQEETLKAQQMMLLQFRDEKFGQKGELAQMSEKALAPILEKVNKAIEEVAKEEKMNLVLDKGNSAVRYAEDKLDITYKVMDRIKRGNK